MRNLEMRRIRVSLSKRQVHELDALEATMGIPLSEIVRRAVDEYLAGVREGRLGDDIPRQAAELLRQRADNADW